jgi:hypothetical protein
LAAVWPRKNACVHIARGNIGKTFRDGTLIFGNVILHRHIFVPHPPNHALDLGAMLLQIQKR